MNEIVSVPNRKGVFPFVTVFVVLYAILFLPFWKPILLGFIFAAACSPLLQRLRNNFHTRRSSWAYAFVAFSIISLVAVFSALSIQTYTIVYQFLRQPNNLGALGDRMLALRENFIRWLEQGGIIGGASIRRQLREATVTITDQAKELALSAGKAFLTSAPQILLNLFIFLLSFALLLVVWPKVWGVITRLFNTKDADRAHFEKFERICEISLGSILLIGLVQALIVTVGATAAGLDPLLLIFMATFIFSLVPLLGAGSLPTVLGLFSLMEGDTRAAVILLVTALIAGSADNVLRAWLFSKAAKTNPIISLISLLGALSLLGFTGLFVAPVLEQLVMAYFWPEPETARKASVPRGAGVRTQTIPQGS